jgi:hypothetical protein
MTGRRLLSALVVALVAALLPAAPSAPLAPASASSAPRSGVPEPTVVTVPAGLRNAPFMGLLRVPEGYVQEEYLVSGSATPYGPASILAGGPADLTGAPALPYATRVVVVRPRVQKRSNDAAVVTWHNVTFGHDIGEWFNIGREVVRRGWTYVEASVQPASMPALKAYDPVRYGSVLLPGDAYAHDIFSQVGKAARSGSLTGGRPLREVVAIGASQSGSALNHYLELVQPRYEKVYDGFVVAVSNGPDYGNDVPVLRLLSENEVDGSSASPDAQTYRQWEVAGSAHGAKSDFAYIGAQEKRDLGVDLVNPLAGDRAPAGLGTCLVNRFPMWQAHDAALAALRRWIRTGRAPRPQPRMVVRDGTIVRDARGNGRGGVRLPAIAVPRAAYNRTGDCVMLDGRTEPFTPDQLRRLYPTRKHYLRKLRTAVKRSVRRGVLTRSDARWVLRKRGRLG